MKKYIEIPFKEYTLRGYHHNTNSEQCLVMLHGYTGNCNEDNRFRGMSEELEKHNIDTIRVDFLCHGESDLTFEDMRFSNLVEQGKTILKYAHTLGYKEVHLLGFSMGGLTALHLLEEDFNKVILMSPAFGFRSHVEAAYSRLKKKDNPVVDYNARILSKEFVDSLKDINETKYSKSFTKQLFVITGLNDQVIKKEAVIEGMNHYQNVSLNFIDNCNHGYSNINARKELNNLVLSYLKL